MTTTLNPKLIIAPDLQMVFLDKDTALPLAGGKVYFYQDTARTIPKPVYKLTGTAGAYSYVALANPTTLTSYGTFADDDGNDIVPYYFPYDGTPSSTLGTIDLYYVAVFSSDETGNVPQFTREAWPNIAEGSATATPSLTNYVPNPQFLMHYDLPATSTLAAGQIRDPITIIGQGGWTFERPSGSTATDFVTFYRYPGYVTNPTGNPRYAVNVSCTSANSGDLYKDLRLKFDNVNMFASSTDYYTFSLSGMSNTLNSVPMGVYVIKNFGSGGDPQTETFIGTITLTGSETAYPINILFGSNSGKTIGSDDDDYIQIALRFNTSTTFDVKITDFILTPGQSVSISEFPATTNAESISQSIAGWLDVPNYDAKNLYLPLILTPYGLTYDSSQVGKIYIWPTDTAPTGHINCDSSKYIYSSTFSDGVPCSRLGDVLWNSSLNVFQFGTGLDYMTVIDINDVAGHMIINNNTKGTVTAATAGTTSFTVSTISTSTDCASYCYAGGLDVFENTLTITNNGTGGINAGTSGFTVSTVRGNASIRQVMEVETVAAAALASTYFYFHTALSGDKVVTVWFKVDGSGSNPHVTDINIEVDLLSTDVASIVAYKIQAAINGWQNTLIECVAASSITGGQYFTINTTNGTTQIPYVIWYKKDGTGAIPTATGTKIEVDIVSADTASQVASKTQIAINKYSYALPDTRGLFIRGFNGSQTELDFTDDQFGNFRLAYTIPQLQGNNVSTYELYSVESHLHSFSQINIVNEDLTATGATFTIPSGTVSADTNDYGLAETRPTNISLNYIIKY